MHLLRDHRSALRARLSHDGLDALLVTHPANVFYLTSFRGSAGVVVLTLDGACLITDSRYATVAQGLAAAEAGVAGLTFVQVESSYEETVCDVLKDLGISLQYFLIVALFHLLLSLRVDLIGKLR